MIVPVRQLDKALELLSNTHTLVVTAAGFDPPDSVPLMQLPQLEYLTQYRVELWLRQPLPQGEPEKVMFRGDDNLFQVVTFAPLPRTTMCELTLTPGQLVHLSREAYDQGVLLVWGLDLPIEFLVNDLPWTYPSDDQAMSLAQPDL